VRVFYRIDPMGFLFLPCKFPPLAAAFFSNGLDSPVQPIRRTSLFPRPSTTFSPTDEYSTTNCPLLDLLPLLPSRHCFPLAPPFHANPPPFAWFPFSPPLCERSDLTYHQDLAMGGKIVSLGRVMFPFFSHFSLLLFRLPSAG